MTNQWNPGTDRSRMGVPNLPNTPRGAAMSGIHADAPGILPVLSKGKHRNARKGACFMEFASYLAGERWSDHPSCTHPLLSELARLVNDHTSDEQRPDRKRVGE